MRSWNTKEAKIVLDWARTPLNERRFVDELAIEVGRTIAAIYEFIRRALPADERPWPPKPRWGEDEVKALQERGEVESRSRAAAQKYAKRHGCFLGGEPAEEDDSERSSLSVSQVADDLGLSRASVYRLLKEGVLRRFKGGIAETTFETLLKEHPELIPYHRLPPEKREWLVLNGYPDPSSKVKPPSVKGWLK